MIELILWALAIGLGIVVFAAVSSFVGDYRRACRRFDEDERSRLAFERSQAYANEIMRRGRG